MAAPFTDDEAHATLLRERGIGYADVGVSGGVWGKTEGYALMVGGSDADFARILPLLEALKPEGDSGLVHAGPVGAGHFAKMVHNGIEYGMMQAFGEGYEMLQANDLIEHPDDVIASWQSGSVVRSWLLDLLVLALEADPELSRIAGTAPDSGEARWMIEAGLNLAVPLPVTTASLFARFAARKNQPPSMQVVAAMREQFGGHASTRRAT